MLELYIGHERFSYIRTRRLEKVCCEAEIFLCHKARLVIRSGTLFWRTECAERVGEWIHAVVSKLWPDDPSTQVEETVRNVKICKNGQNYVVAATPEKSETYVFDGIKVRDREVGGSNPLAPTN